MEDILKSEFLIKSVIKVAQTDGIPIYIRKKGDLDAGCILIKIDLLDGTGKLLRRNMNYSMIKDENFIEYTQLHKSKTLKNEEIEKKIISEINIDQDIWIVEIEDKHGINYFEKF
tara:strand:+ start:38 stop:382 length:345 start_codon:yes stop_codon:yes gene_type:complete